MWSSALRSSAVAGIARRSLTATARKMCTFKSNIAVENLYPAGCAYSERFKTLTSHPSMEQKAEGFSGYIPMEALKVTYTYSFGQDLQATPVHATNPPTKVDIRFHLKSATWLSESVKAKVAEKYNSQLTKDGFFVVKSDRTRSQMLNQADALRRLRDAIWAALESSPELTEDEQLEVARKARIKAGRMRLRETKT